MPCTFTFVDIDNKGVSGKRLRDESNFLFMLEWLAIFGFNRVTSKEAAAMEILLRLLHTACIGNRSMLFSAFAIEPDHPNMQTNSRAGQLTCITGQQVPDHRSMYTL